MLPIEILLHRYSMKNFSTVTFELYYYICIRYENAGWFVSIKNLFSFSFSGCGCYEYFEWFIVDLKIDFFFTFSSCVRYFQYTRQSKYNNAPIMKCCLQITVRHFEFIEINYFRLNLLVNDGLEKNTNLWKMYSPKHNFLYEETYQELLCYTGQRKNQESYRIFQWIHHQDVICSINRCLCLGNIHRMPSFDTKIQTIKMCIEVNPK